MENSLFYLNGEVIATVSASNESPVVGYSANTDDDWELLSTGTKTIEWKEVLTAAALAALIASCFSAMGVPEVITSMGSTTLATIAGLANRAEVYMEVHMFWVPPIPASYRYMWTVTPNGSSVTYGPYYYVYA